MFLYLGIELDLVLVEDNQGTDYARNPSTQGKDEDNQYRSAAFVNYGKRRKIMERITLINDISVSF